jgi:transglutaminase-like putative cysteine protease
VKYQYGTSDASTSAVDTAKTRIGVCRDFAHLGIALCRSYSIPARMVVGYLYQLDPMDLHAWFEAYLGDRGSTTEGRWFTFDATQSEPRGNRIAIAYGRDATDVALATQYGPLTLNEMHVWVETVEA